MTIYQKGMHYSEESHQWHLDGDALVGIHHVTFGMVEVKDPDGKISRRNQEVRKVDHVKYKDWEWRCRRCFPDKEQKSS